jgi:hypothetical protein
MDIPNASKITRIISVDTEPTAWEKARMNPEPVKENTMTRFEVVTQEVIRQEVNYVVEAENEDHAIQLVLDGEYEDAAYPKPRYEVPEVVSVEIIE